MYVDIHYLIIAIILCVVTVQFQHREQSPLKHAKIDDFALTGGETGSLHSMTGDGSCSP